MKNRGVTWAAIAVTSLVVTASAWAENAVTCPVSGKAVDKTHLVAYLGNTLYLCGDDAPATFAKTPQAFADKAKLQLLATGQITQTRCPVMGGAVDKVVTVEVEGVMVFLCSPPCKAKIEVAPDKPAFLFKNFAKHFTLQTTCPITGKAIDPNSKITCQGKEIYFYDRDGIKTLPQNPEKYVEKLPVAP